MEEDQWEDMLANAAGEVYYQCDVEINGEMFYRVGIRPKGNTSLTAIASDPDTDRYSFKLEFDQYVDGQSCFGLDKLILNNNYADATNMKEALIYDMYQYLGADASLYNYAAISVNDEYWGVYLALEAVEDSFLLRNYGTESGALYKPESMNMGGGAFSMEDGFFSMDGGGADLNYTDDELDHYAAIWEGEITNTTEKDHKRVVKALKHISEGTELEQYMDVDNLLKYMAVHVFSVNEDSLSGMMAHNYYLYEADGQLNILPWDYNLALGGMGGRESAGGATGTVNDGIDNAFAGTEFFDTLVENEAYHGAYYGYLEQLAEAYLGGGGFEDFYRRTRSQIDALVESDPTAFYTYQEYSDAAETLYEVVQLRGQSISGQIEGTIPSTEEAQRNSDALVDASHLDLSIMGSMSMGDDLRGRNVSESEVPFGDGELPADFEPPQFGGEVPGGFGVPQPGDGGQGEKPSGESTEEQLWDRAPWGEREQRGSWPDRKVDGTAGTAREDNLIMYGVCLLILTGAFVFVKKYHRNSAPGCRRNRTRQCPRSRP